MKSVVTHIIIWFCCVSTFSQSQFDAFFKPSDTLNIARRNAVVISESAISGLTLLALNQLWYADFKRGKFHATDDSNQWLQMDKLGHVFSSYHLGRFSADALNWSGVRKKDQLIYGATLGFTFLTAIEVFDGFSEEWGFSWSDMAANAAGTGLYIGQELLWNEQRIMLKYSFHQTRFAKQNPNKLGNGLLEEVLKDYNGQTYWLSFNLQSFLKNSRIPKWLNLALGYSGEGMLNGVNNSVNELFASTQSYRQYFISFDVDLTKIKTNSNFLKSVFSVFSSIKVPFPALEINEKSNAKFHLIYF